MVGDEHADKVAAVLPELEGLSDSNVERRHRLRMAAGNGLRPDIWEHFQRRFGIPHVREYYGATEAPAPLVNFTGRLGMIGRVLPGTAVVRCDQETGEIQRDARGRCIRLRPGETGLLLFRVTGNNYEGYLDEEASRSKIVKGAFAERDRHFNTGDLVTLHEDGWLGFADRVGDTFRWKGENVSTNEVAEVLNGAPGVLESNVYGVQVPGADGRAGMASLRVDPEFSVEGLAAYVREHLPVYQRPCFVRLQSEMRVSVTLKHQKADYRREGYDPSRVADPLYVLDGQRYVVLDTSIHEAIRAGRISLR